MKNLTKRLFFLSLPLISVFNPVNSKAQDFLPGMFRDYQKDTSAYVLEERITDSGKNYVIKRYDLNNDSIADIAEMYFLIIEDNKRKRFKYPVMYLIRFDSTNIKILIDEELDGLNGNEKFYNKSSDDSLKENL